MEEAPQNSKESLYSAHANEWMNDSYGSLNLLKPSGPVQACNGIALPLCDIFVPNTSNT
jgi:hypothetical protein